MKQLALATALTCVAPGAFAEEVEEPNVPAVTAPAVVQDTSEASEGSGLDILIMQLLVTAAG